MNLLLNLPPDLEAILKRRADQAGLDIREYILQALRLPDVEPLEETITSDEQFAASLRRLAEIHASAPAQFDDSRESIYEGRGE
jgi:hypothetical protein